MPRATKVKKRVKKAKPKPGSRNDEHHDVDPAELAAGKKAKQDRIDIHEMHVYGLESITQLYDLREKAAGYNVTLEELVTDTNVAKEKYQFDDVNDYYLARKEAGKHQVTIEQLLIDRGVAMSLNQVNVEAYYDLRAEGLKYRVTPQQLLLDRAEARKLHLGGVPALYEQRLEERVRDIRICVAPANAQYCKVIRSKLGGDYVYYGDFMDTTMYRFNDSWAYGNYATRMRRRACKGLPSCVIVHRPWFKNSDLKVPLAASLFPAALFQTPVIEATPAQKGNPEDEGEEELARVSVVEDIVRNLLKKKANYELKVSFFKVGTPPDRKQACFTWSDLDGTWLPYSSQDTVPAVSVESWEEMTKYLSRSMLTKSANELPPPLRPDINSDVYGLSREEKRARKEARARAEEQRLASKPAVKNLSIMSPPWLSAGAPPHTQMNAFFPQQTSWVLRLLIRRRKGKSSRVGVISLVDLSGNADSNFAQANKAVAKNLNLDLLSIQKTLSAYGSEAKRLPKESYQSNVLYHLLRPSLTVSPGLKIPTITRKIQKVQHIDDETLAKIHSLSGNYVGTFAVVVVELGRHDIDHRDRLNSWASVYGNCTGYQKALIIQMCWRVFSARAHLHRLKEAAQRKKEELAAIKIQTRMRIRLAKNVYILRKKEKKKAELKAKQDKLKAEKKKQMEEQRALKRAALEEKKRKKEHEQIMAEGGYLPEGWKKEMRGTRWCFQDPDGNWGWEDPRK